MPRSRHHLKLLADNDAAPDLLIYRDADLAGEIERRFGGRPSIYLGREERPRANPLSLPGCRRRNRAYYADVGARIDQASIERWILFLEGEPLERFLLAKTPEAEVELWEDGLSHYLDLTSPLWYRARAALQMAGGFYPGGILDRRLDRSGITVRDRFERRNLRYAAPPRHEPRDEILLIGSPLVEDRIVSPARFVRAVQTLAAASPVPIRYLQHPREDATALRRRLDQVPEGIAAEMAPVLGPEGGPAFLGYISALSTGLLDLGAHDRSLYIPGLFGLTRPDRQLGGWAHNPVAMARDAGTFHEWAARLSHTIR